MGPRCERRWTGPRRRWGRAPIYARSTSSDAEGVADAARATAAALGRIDALVCSAGITGPNTTTWEYPADAWRQVIDVNLNGVFYCNRAIVPVMLAQNYGRIVNIASVAGKEGNPERERVQCVEGRGHRADQVAGQGAREDRACASTA